jgi:ribonucleoside-diphosphate reductase alpha chain
MLFETGHPWITFKDACNIRSPQSHVGVIHNSNLCTEITLNNSREETAVCNIGSINLATHVSGTKLDYKMLEETVGAAIRMLDNTIDPNFYPTEETRRANTLHRPIGLGLMGFQEALYAGDIDFESEEAVKFADESMEFISYHAIKTSAELAAEKGAYSSFKGSKWDQGIFPVDTLDLLEAERGMPISVSRSSKMDWKPLRALVKKNGLRNSNMMAIAPTATISNINGCIPTIEPSYKNLYVKSNMSGEFTVVNQHLVADLKRLGLWNQTMLEQIKAADGSVQDITTIPPKLRAKYRTAFESNMQALIKVAAYRGKWIDQSQSLNIFFQGSSGKALADLYLSAWHLGLKTTYYLRTVAASNIEKSTLEIAQQRIVGERIGVTPETITEVAYTTETVVSES